MYSNQKRLPQIKWGQDSEQVHLSYEIRDARIEKIEIMEKRILFHVYAKEMEYYSELDLYESIDVEQSIYQASPSQIRIQLKKRETTRWPRLVSDTTSVFNNNISVNWDQYQYSDDEEERVAMNPFDPMNFDPSRIQYPLGRDEEEEEEQEEEFEEEEFGCDEESQEEGA